MRLSGGCLINLTIDWTEDPLNGKGAYRVDEMDYLFTLFLPEAHRWRRLFVAIIDYSLMFYVVRRLQSVAAPNLSELSLSDRGEKDPSQVLKPAELEMEHMLFQSPPGAPMIHEVTLWGVHVDWSSPFLSSNLRKLTLSYHALDVRPSPQKFLDILSACRETLEALRLEDSGPAVKHDEDWGPYVSQKIELPNLRTLTVAFVPPKYAGGIFELLVARNVNELTLNFEMWDTQAGWNALIRQICLGNPGSSGPMFPALTQLRLLSLPADPIHLGTLLFYYPTITSLVVDFRYTDDGLLGILGHPIPQIGVPPSELPGWATALHSTVAQYHGKPIAEGQSVDESARREPWLCPELRRLKVYGTYGEQVRLLVARRQEGGVPLKEVLYAHTCSMMLPNRAWLASNLEVFEEFMDDEIPEYAEADEQPEGHEEVEGGEGVDEDEELVEDEDNGDDWVRGVHG